MCIINLILLTARLYVLTIDSAVFCLVHALLGEEKTEFSH